MHLLRCINFRVLMRNCEILVRRCLLLCTRNFDLEKTKGRVKEASAK